MAKIITYDPKSGEAKSPLIAGLTEAVSKISEILNLNTAQRSEVPLNEVYISDKDRYRIYQVDFGNRLWLTLPNPIIRKNGNIINPATDFFEIDYIGGSIAFDENYRLTSSDTLTADFTCVISESANMINILNDISQLKEKAKHDKGFYENEETLTSQIPTGENGDYAIVGETDTIWVWDSTTSNWVDSHKKTNLDNYYTKEEANLLLSAKEPTINVEENQKNNGYYLTGYKSFYNFYDSVKATVLSEISTQGNTNIESTDTLINAFGKTKTFIDQSPEKFRSQKAITIPSNSDLNDAAYWKEGEYCCEYYTTNIANAPVAGAFHLRVFKFAGGYYIQEYTVYNSGDVYRRIGNTTSQKPWQVFAGTAQPINPENGWGTSSTFKPTASKSGRIVCLTGAIINGTSSVGTTILTLPERYRPAKRELVPVYNKANGSICFAVIETSGLMQITSGGNWDNGEKVINVTFIGV